jgi:pimeloyl-ACP methyl ester carboxylesterase
MSSTTSSLSSLPDKRTAAGGGGDDTQRRRGEVTGGKRGLEYGGQEGGGAPSRNRRMSSGVSRKQLSAAVRRTSLMTTDPERLGELPSSRRVSVGAYPPSGSDSRRSSMHSTHAPDEEAYRRRTSAMIERRSSRGGRMDPDRVHGELPDRKSSFDAYSRRLSVRSLVQRMEQPDGSGSRRSSLADAIENQRGGRRTSVAISSALNEDRYNCVAELFCGRVGYADVGDPSGLPVFIFTGLGGHRYNALLFDSVARRRGLRIICPDRPGVGLSESLPPGVSPAETVRHSSYMLRQLASHLDIPHLAVLAHSLGCVFALQTASDPESAPLLDGTTVCLVSPWALPGSPSPTHCKLRGMQDVDLDRDRSSLRQLAVGRTRAKGLMLSTAEAAALDSEAAEQVRSCIAAAAEPHGRDLTEAIADYGEELSLPLHLIEAKVFICHGKCDSVVPLEDAEWLEEALPHAQLAVRNGGTHGLLYDRQVLDRLFSLLSEELSAVYRRSACAAVPSQARHGEEGEADWREMPNRRHAQQRPWKLDRTSKLVLSHAALAILLAILATNAMEANVSLIRRLMFF